MIGTAKLQQGIPGHIFHQGQCNPLRNDLNKVLLARVVLEASRTPKPQQKAHQSTPSDKTWRRRRGTREADGSKHIAQVIGIRHKGAALVMHAL